MLFTLPKELVACADSECPKRFKCLRFDNNPYSSRTHISASLRNKSDGYDQHGFIRTKKGECTLFMAKSPVPQRIRVSLKCSNF